MLPAPTKAELALFTGRSEASFDAYFQAALEQATLLLALLTGLDALPDDPQQAKLVKFAIMELADQLILEQPYKEETGGPFSSETLGGYSYAQSQSFVKAKERKPLGLLWWDLAVEMLAGGERSKVASGAIRTDNGLFRALDTGEPWIVGPHELGMSPDVHDVAW